MCDRRTRRAARPRRLTSGPAGDGFVSLEECCCGLDRPLRRAAALATAGYDAERVGNAHAELSRQVRPVRPRAVTHAASPGRETVAAEQACGGAGLRARPGPVTRLLARPAAAGSRRPRSCRTVCS